MDVTFETQAPPPKTILQPTTELQIIVEFEKDPYASETTIPEVIM